MANATQQTAATAQAPAAAPAADEFAALYAESRDDLYSYLRYLTGDASLAEELLASSFERAFRKRALFRRERGELRGWLFRIARNAAVDAMRRGGQLVALELQPEHAAARDEQALADDRMLVAQAMRRLRPQDRELIALKFFAGLENDEIARVLRISRSNAGTQLHRAIGRLRAQIGEGSDA
jgi:RNA polymerase sigma-70 factor (ECF subfamily)